MRASQSFMCKERILLAGNAPSANGEKGDQSGLAPHRLKSGSGLTADPIYLPVPER